MAQTYHHALRLGSYIDGFIDRYKIESILGVGGFGITYLAYDERRKRRVAIKEYLPDTLAMRNPDGISVTPKSSESQQGYAHGLKQFLNEARTLARFEEPTIVEVYEFLEANDTAYMVMKYEQGRDLKDYLKENPRPDEATLKNIFIPILEGLRTIHQREFLHRDIKPGNIYLRDQGPALLIDFGSARHALGGHSLSMTAVVTPGYAPFEQYSSRSKQEASTDLYAIGATLYRCVAGKAPAEASERMAARVSEEADPMTPAKKCGAEHYSEAFLETIDWMLQPLAKDRPQRVDEVLDRMLGSGTETDNDHPPQIEPTETLSTNIEPIRPPPKPNYEPPSNKPANTEVQPAPPTVTSPSDATVAPELQNNKQRWFPVVLVSLLVMGVFYGGWLLLKPQPKIPDTAGLTKPAVAPDVETPVESHVQEELEKQKQQRELDQQREKARQEALARQQKEDDQRQQEQIRRQTLAKLLADAAQDIENLRLRTPKGNNAVEKYREVLRLDLQNQAALQGLNAVVDKYLELAEEAQKAQDDPGFLKAEKYLRIAKSIVPGHPALQQAEDNLETARRAYQREKERLAELEKQRQAEADKREQQRLAELENQKLTDSYTGMQFVAIDPDCFQMGSNSGDADEKPVHRVCLTGGYYLGKYEVTQAQWQKVMGDNPSDFKGSNKPVENVSWEDVQTFIGKLNRQTGREYRLPSEAEWEYACRSGGKDQKYCGSNSINSVAWYFPNLGIEPHSVGQKQPNGLGLYDMSGNVWEWVQDWYDDDYYSSSLTNNPKGPSSGSDRVYRGGSWFYFASSSRAANRNSRDPGYRDGGLLGFRLARTR